MVRFFFHAIKQLVQLFFLLVGFIFSAAFPLTYVLLEFSILFVKAIIFTHELILCSKSILLNIYILVDICMDPEVQKPDNEEISYQKISLKEPNEERSDNPSNEAPQENQESKQQSENKQNPTQNEKQVKEEKKEEIKLSQSEENQRPISVKDGKQQLDITQTMPEMQENEVEIQIQEIYEKGFALGKQTYSRIVGKDKHGPIDIERSASQFESLRRILLQRWPGCFIPSLTEKSEIKSEERRIWYKKKCYENFIKKLGKSSFLYYKEQVQHFLRSENLNVSEMFSKMPVLKIKDVIDRFQSCFNEQVEKQATPQNATFIANFSTSLKKVTVSLGDLAKQSLKLAQSYHTYAQSMHRLGNFLKNYEKTCLREYVQNDSQSTIILRDDQDKVDELAKMSEGNIFYQYYYLFESEARDAEALADIILAMEVFNIRRDDIERKAKQKRIQIDQIYLGHKSLKIMTSRKTKEEVQAELEGQEKDLLAEKHLIVELFSIVQIVLAEKTIPIFKNIKYNEYFNIIHLWIKTTGQVNPEIESIWKWLYDESQSQLHKL